MNKPTFVKKFSDLEGRTIKAVVHVSPYSDEVIFRMEDGELAVIGREGWDGDNYPVLETDRTEDNWARFGDDTLALLGLFDSEASARKWRKERDAEAAKRVKDYEMREYLRLQAKFGGRS